MSKKIRLLGAVLAPVLLLSACADIVLESVCRENGTTRACTKEEQDMIDGMHGIMRTVFHFDPGAINAENFHLSGSHNASVSFFGETHTGVIGQIDTLGVINALTKKGDVMLLEGEDKNAAFDFDDCGRYLIYRIYLNSRYKEEHERQNKPYEGDGAAKFQHKNGLRQIYAITKESYDLKALNLAFLKCGFWDDRAAMNDAIKKITYANMKARNLSMVDAIDRELAKKNRVFVLTGFGHMPLGEKLMVLSRNWKDRERLLSRWKTLDEFYAHIRAERNRPKAARSIKVDDDAGSSRVIYNYLKNNKIAYREYIPRKM